MMLMILYFLRDLNIALFAFALPYHLPIIFKTKESKAMVLLCLYSIVSISTLVLIFEMLNEYVFLEYGFYMARIATFIVTIASIVNLTKYQIFFAVDNMFDTE